MDWVNAPANLMPLSRDSNATWSSANPGAVLHQENLSYDSHGDLFEGVFVNEQAFKYLSEGAGGIPHFWKARADTLASHVEKLLDVADEP